MATGVAEFREDYMMDVFAFEVLMEIMEQMCHIGRADEELRR